MTSIALIHLEATQTPTQINNSPLTTCVTPITSISSLIGDAPAKWTAPQTT